MYLPDEIDYSEAEPIWEDGICIRCQQPKEVKLCLCWECKQEIKQEHE